MPTQGTGDGGNGGGEASTKLLSSVARFSLKSCQSDGVSATESAATERERVSEREKKEEEEEREDESQKALSASAAAK